MLNVHMICVGRLKEPFYIQAACEYRKRLSAYCRLTVVELPEQPLPANPSPAQVEKALAREAAEIAARLPKTAVVTALCVEGTLLSSEAFAETLCGWTANGASALVFLIGGSFGLHASLKERAALRLSMSPMTFPHHLAQVMALEQLYRAFKIGEGSRYHK
jgi:23S rRNA (pseudouridine1915-N3)-methyltransferase